MNTTIKAFRHRMETRQTFPLWQEARCFKPWYVLGAEDAFRQGHFRLIPQRNNRKMLYLARFWLSAPHQGLEDDESSSADSVLLHYFASGDDDDALHDHRWDFRTIVLAGGYTEAVPPPWWVRSADCFGKRTYLAGPPLDQCPCRSLEEGDSAYHSTEPWDLHAVTHVQPGTWTLVQTGQQERDDWGFWPGGKTWIGHKEFLEEKFVESRA